MGLKKSVLIFKYFFSLKWVVCSSMTKKHFFTPSLQPYLWSFTYFILYTWLLLKISKMFTDCAKIILIYIRAYYLRKNSLIINVACYTHVCYFLSTYLYILLNVHNTVAGHMNTHFEHSPKVCTQPAVHTQQVLVLNIH